MNILVLVGLLVLLHDTFALRKRFNFTQLLDGPLNSRYYTLREIPHSRDVSYLPEDDYLDFEEGNGEQHLDRDNRNLMPEYRNLCETMTRTVQLTDSDYEYQPPHYHEVYCKGFSLINADQRATRSVKQKCAHPGFHCVQRSRTLFMVRRRWESECWEPLTKEIASGCDCMWPVSILGDIVPHY